MTNAAALQTRQDSSWTCHVTSCIWFQRHVWPKGTSVALKAKCSTTCANPCSLSSSTTDPIFTASARAALFFGLLQCRTKNLRKPTCQCTNQMHFHGAVRPSTPPHAVFQLAMLQLFRGSNRDGSLPVLFGNLERGKFSELLCHPLMLQMQLSTICLDPASPRAPAQPWFRLDCNFAR